MMLEMVFVVFLLHVPAPALILEKAHRSALSETAQSPAYTEIWPAADMEGMKAEEPSVVNGRSCVMISKEELEEDRVEDMFMPRSWSGASREKIYAISDESRTVVGLYGNDWPFEIEKRLHTQRAEEISLLMMSCQHA